MTKYLIYGWLQSLAIYESASLQLPSGYRILLYYIINKLFAFLIISYYRSVTKIRLIF